MKEMMMIYSIPQANKKTRVQFVRQLYYHEVKSHQGKYIHKTNGILNEFRKPTNACIIFKINKMNDVKKLCKEYSIKANFYKIEEVV